MGSGRLSSFSGEFLIGEGVIGVGVEGIVIPKMLRLGSGKKVWFETGWVIRDSWIEGWSRLMYQHMHSCSCSLGGHLTNWMQPI